jgi:hypothetical protein
VTDENEKLSAGAWVMAGMSFIPLIGLLFAPIAIVYGLVTRRAGGKKLALVGVAGILVTVVLYGGLIYLAVIQRGGIYDDLRLRMAEGTIVDVVRAIEFYKIQNGKYPESLDVLRTSLPENSFVFVFDPTDVNLKSQPRPFHYELVDAEHYYLLGVGSDGQPFTADDLVPRIEPGADSKMGLLIKANQDDPAGAPGP